MRVFFSKKGAQRMLIDRILLKISFEEAATLCNLSERTIRDWHREKFSVDLKALRELCRKTKTSFPSNVKLKDDYWYTVNGSSAGGIAVFKKYGRIGGDSEYRKKKWYEWWEREGKYKDHPIINTPLPIKKPRKSKALAEFVGIVLGDGGISKSQISISFNSKDEKEYAKFVKSLIRRLFDVYVGTCFDKEYLSFDLLISRIKLIHFCIEKLDLKRGNKVKQQVDIPEWIKQNKSYLIACVRGLMDTDGCAFTHRYRVNGKLYSYKKLAFKNSSYPLIRSVYDFLKNILLLHPRISKDFKEVRIESKRDVEKYFQLIGFHNPKNLKRYKN